MIGGTRVDYWRETLIKRAFMGGGTQNGAVGTFSAIQLWNPADSGKTLICDTITVGVPEAIRFALRHHNAVLTGVGGEGNKYLAEAVPVGEIHTQSGVAFGTDITPYRISAGKLTHTIKFLHPIIIGEGLGLIVQLYIANIDCTGTFEWIEV